MDPDPPAAVATAVAAPDPQAWRLVREGPVLARLDELSVVEVEGPEADSFLHGQLTVAVHGRDAGDFPLGGYCNAKGRLLAIFNLWREGETVRLLLPAALAAPTARRLAAYVLRAKAKVRDAGGAWVVSGLLGPGWEARLRELDWPLPPGVWTAVEVRPGVRLARLAPSADGNPRWQLVARAETAESVLARLAVPVVPAALWWWSQVDAAVPSVLPPTVEAFVPQAVNLELLGGVDFRKGCYPGQEVVARSQYLGKLRRRMGIAHTPGVAAAGDDLFHDAEPGQPVGRVVLAAPAPGGGVDLLYECPTASTGTGSLHAGSVEAPALRLRPLPYPIFDPTA